MADREQAFPRTAVLTALGLAVLLAVGVVIAAQVSGGDENAAPPSPTQKPPRTGPLPVVPVPAPAADSPDCASLLPALPAVVVSNGEQWPRLPLAEPAPRATAAWGTPTGDPAILRCGLDRPAELTPTSALREVNGVRWLPVSREDATTFWAVDRAVFVVLTVPPTAGTGVLQDVSTALGRALPPRR
ncbi:uncharacterized protein DUF3515 [Herbihabitans rhizosphaerae]|uniref:Uncharacterized protein DUF3515 n=1 Tax=Herbihabitans rhizosphaerae TaxID=1872711 RepID=A0A4Q7KRT3_9PSEU|nr:DUF3515 domain-containing protein [Herbihabitans rhizosphaerae]RZS39275.1 uncharacterized protein DUF3515 [Herbihabitans rhizosphaerae]